MNLITLEGPARQIAEYERLRRASQQVHLYEFERITGTNRFRVSQNGKTYVTGETHCSCKDAERHPELRCKHQRMVEARLDVEGRISQAEISAQARADRALWG